VGVTLYLKGKKTYQLYFRFVEFETFLFHRRHHHHHQQQQPKGRPKGFASVV
jgi:hypothetical protein